MGAEALPTEREGRRMPAGSTRCFSIPGRIGGPIYFILGQQISERPLQ